MSMMIENEEELEVEVSEPMLDALADISEKFKSMLQEQISQHPLISQEDRNMAFSSVCQMLTMDSIMNLAEEIECSPLDVVDSWVDAFYEAFDEDEETCEEDEEEEEEDEEDGE